MCKKTWCHKLQKKGSEPFYISLHLVSTLATTPRSITCITESRCSLDGEGSRKEMVVVGRKDLNSAPRRAALSEPQPIDDAGSSLRREARWPRLLVTAEGAPAKSPNARATGAYRPDRSGGSVACGRWRSRRPVEFGKSASADALCALAIFCDRSTYHSTENRDQVVVDLTN